MNDEKRERRKIKLIKPRMQLRLIGVFVGLSALGFILQSLHLSFRLSELASSMPEGGSHLMAVMPELPIEILLFSFGMLLPLTTAIGIYVTHRIAGPVYRFEKHLSEVARGEDVRPCKIRKGDELQELCEIINQAVAALREGRDRTIEEDKPQPTEPERIRKAG